MVRNDSGEVLFILRNGIWDLPKGKAETGESSEESALREVTEECGIQGQVIKNYILKTFHAYILNGRPILKETDWYEMHVGNHIATKPETIENITEVRWVNPEELPSIAKYTFPLIVDVLKEAKLL